MSLDVDIPPNPKKTGDTHKGKKKKSPSDSATANAVEPFASAVVTTGLSRYMRSRVDDDSSPGRSSAVAYGECTIQRLFTCQWFFQHLPTSERIDRPGRWPCCGASKPEVRWQCCEC